MDISKLRKTARKYIEEITANHPTVSLPTELLPTNVDPISLAECIESLELSTPSESRKEWSFENVVILEAFLSRKYDGFQEASEQEAAFLLRKWVADAILPSNAFAETSPYSAEEKPAPTPDFIAKEHEFSLKGLQLLSHLQELLPVSPPESTIMLYTCLASFSDSDDAWTSQTAEQQAQDLAETSITPDQIPGLIHALLEERVKPLFARSRNPAITQQGRKAINPLPIPTSASIDVDVEAKPWKYGDMYIVTVFQWVLHHLDPETIESNWPLIIPPLLALIDDSSIHYKAKGCLHLTIFLISCPSPLLERTALDTVFENAIMPCLMHLPSLTPETESLQLLKAAYPALIALACMQFTEKKQQDARCKALDRILRYGVLKGYSHAGENVRIAELLMEQVVDLVIEMGVASVKHLKYVLPMISGNLAAPFATAYPPLLEASIKALETVMIKGGSRIVAHRGEILKGLTVCWCRIKEEEVVSEELERVQRSLKILVRQLTLLVRGNVDVTAEYQKLIDCDERLRDFLMDSWVVELLRRKALRP